MILTEQQYQERLDRLAKLRVSLDSDITTVSIPHLLNKLAEIQNQRNRASSALVEAFNNRAEAKAIFEDAKAELDMQMDNLLATDENVKQQKTAEMRTSLASTKCADLAMKKHHALLVTLRADSYFDTVNEIANNLKDVHQTLEEQVGFLKFSVEAGIITLNDLVKNQQPTGGSQQ